MEQKVIYFNKTALLGDPKYFDQATSPLNDPTEAWEASIILNYELLSEQKSAIIPEASENEMFPSSKFPLLNITRPVLKMDEISMKSIACLHNFYLFLKFQVDSYLAHKI